jgi:hypothetical protein
MRKGFDGLAGLVQTVLGEDPLSGHLFVFRGRRGHLAKVLWWRRRRLLPVQQEIGPRALRVAAGVERHDGGSERGAVVDVVGRHRLAAA